MRMSVRQAREEEFVMKAPGLGNPLLIDDEE